MNELKKDLQTPSPQKSSSNKGCLISLVIVAIVVCCFFFFIILIIVLLFSANISSGLHSETQLKQTYISGVKSSKNKIALISINGIIQANDYSWGQTANMKTIRDQLKEAARDREVKAVLLYINSPGGEITATDILHYNIEKLKKTKPVILVGGFWKPLVDLIITDDPDSSWCINFAAEPDEIKSFLPEEFLPE